MCRLTLIVVIACSVLIKAQSFPETSQQLVETVLRNCAEIDCVKQNVLLYLDNILQIKGGRSLPTNLDAAIFKRVAKVVKTREFRLKLPELLAGTEIVYNPKTGLDLDTQGRGLFLKKKLLLPVLLLLKLKLKALMPIFVALIGLKSLKALILSKLAIVIVLGFIAYQYISKSGMSMPMMSLAPAEPPAPLYGAPVVSTPSSYEPAWEPNSGGPYSRIWSETKENAQNLAYSAYYQGSSTTTRP